MPWENFDRFEKIPCSPMALCFNYITCFHLFFQAESINMFTAIPNLCGKVMYHWNALLSKACFSSVHHVFKLTIHNYTVCVSSTSWASLSFKFFSKCSLFFVFAPTWTTATTKSHSWSWTTLWWYLGMRSGNVTIYYLGSHKMKGTALVLLALTMVSS